MKDLPGYQFLLQEGAIDHTQELLLRLGADKFGEPTEEQAGKLKAIRKLDRLDQLALRLMKVDSWDALLKGR